MKKVFWIGGGILIIAALYLWWLKRSGYFTGFKVSVVSSKPDRWVKYIFNGQEYTHKHGTTAIGVQGGNFSVDIEDLNTPPATQLTLNRGGKPVKQENIYYN